MALPDSPDFNEFLSHLTISEPEIPDGYQFAIDQDNVRIPLPEYKLWYKDIDNLKLKSLISKISSELKTRNHLYNERIVLNLLHIFSLLPKKDEPPVITFNKILDLITSADLTQIFVLPGSPPDDYEFKFGSFSVGLIDMQTLEYRCKKLGSDYYEKYANDLKGKLAFQRDIISVKIVDWWFLLTKELFPYLKSHSKKKSQFNELVNTNFRLVSFEAFESFWDTFLDEQHMAIVMGAGYLDPSELRRMSNCALISIFLNHGKHKKGEVVSYIVEQIFNLPGANVMTTQEAEEKLKGEYNFIDFTNTEIHQTIKTFSRFISKAKMHYYDNKPNEAFLHYVIALDLVLGEKDSSNKSIKERTAVLVHKALGNSYDDQKMIIGKIYDKRSKYVHKGEQTEMRYIKDVEQICYQILLCLLRLQKVNDNHCPGFVSKWLKDIDYISKGIEADKNISESEMQSIGITT